MSRQTNAGNRLKNDQSLRINNASTNTASTLTMSVTDAKENRKGQESRVTDQKNYTKSFSKNANSGRNTSRTNKSAAKKLPNANYGDLSRQGGQVTASKIIRNLSKAALAQSNTQNSQATLTTMETMRTTATASSKKKLPSAVNIMDYTLNPPKKPANQHQRTQSDTFYG